MAVCIVGGRKVKEEPVPSKTEIISQCLIGQVCSSAYLVALLLFCLIFVKILSTLAQILYTFNLSDRTSQFYITAIFEIVYYFIQSVQVCYDTLNISVPSFACVTPVIYQLSLSHRKLNTNLAWLPYYNFTLATQPSYRPADMRKHFTVQCSSDSRKNLIFFLFVFYLFF